jgi:hypothetical protein
MRTSRFFAVLIVPLLPLLAALTSCTNPVHSDAVDALGGEVSGVRPGPTHRPGQPCLTCHGGAGPASPQFVFAGTVFTKRNVNTGAPGVTITLTDANGDAHALLTNSVGNFYLQYANWSPAYPVRVALSSPDVANPPVMHSTIGRNGSCAFCHFAGDNRPDHMPPVYINP